MVSGHKIKHGLKLLNSADKILIVFLLLFIIMGFYLQLSGSQAKNIQVVINDKTFGRYQLTKDQLIKINEGTILEIKDGRFRLRESSCPHQICVKQGWSNGQPIICVPQRIVISVVKESGDKDIPLTY
ncbi:MAG: NusG domain II-containing protein [Candidatus Stygibacter frigidus]|nr:NusG domain II-containing protein [Candidatus Stygibacter frigidus]